LGSPEMVCDTTCENGLNHTYMFVDDYGNVHIAYHRKVAGIWQVFYRRRTSYGWLPEERVVFTDTADAKYPSVAVIRDSIFLAWHDYRVGGITNVEIFFNSKPLTGDTWANEERLTYTNSGSVGDNGYVPTLKVSPAGNLRIVWYDYRDDPAAYDAEIYTKVRTSAGWGEDVRVSDSPGNAWYPAFTYGDVEDSLLIVWADDRDGGYRVYYDDGGSEGSVSDRPGYYPDVAYGHGEYVVVWQDGSGDIYAARRDSSGWSSPIAVHPSPNPQKDPAIFAFGYGFVVVWRQDLDAYDSDIFGVVLRPDLSVADTFRVVQAGTQERPTVFVDSQGYLHLAYVDRSLGASYSRIYYVRSEEPVGVIEGSKRGTSPRGMNSIRGRRIFLRGYDPAGRRSR